MSAKQYGTQFLKGLGEFRVPEEVTTSAIMDFLQSLDCPRSLTVWLLYKNQEHEQLIDLEVNPEDYLEDSFRDAYIATEFLSKSKFLKLDRDLDEVALLKFKQFEELCKETNSRFRSRSIDRLKNPTGVWAPPCDRLKTPTTVWLQNAIRQKIEGILGEFVLQEVCDLANWGPGASTLIKRRHASAPAKFQYETGITRDLFHFVNQPMPLWYPGWVKELAIRGKSVSFEVGNKVVTVPKNAKTNRVIAIEPGFNLWFQLGVGNVIGKRLRKCGIDLRYQARNQRLARKASLDGEHATVDMSSASDSIASAVVEDLLPPQWYWFLDLCRSHYGKYDNQVVKWEKFSSMGNGFTFQLESLIFYAISFCCAKYSGCDTSGVSVYGDDIIIPVGARTSFVEMMQFFGFRINPEKSFFTTPFRESCGTHYLNGMDCKPVYLKDRLSTVSTIYRFANAVRRLASRSPKEGCDVRQRRCFTKLVQSVPPIFRLRIPNSLGDGGFISNFDEATPHVHLSDNRRFQQWEGYVVKQVVDTSLMSERQYPGLLLARLWASDRALLLKENPNEPATVPSTSFQTRVWDWAGLRPDTVGGGNYVPFPGRVRKSLVSTVVLQWDELGPWT